jgi:hypothetical protein
VLSGISGYRRWAIAVADGNTNVNVSQISRHSRNKRRLLSCSAFRHRRTAAARPRILVLMERPLSILDVLRASIS